MPEAPPARGLGPALLAGAGLLGAGGVVLSALAAHLAGGAALGIAGTFCLLHAVAVLAIGIGAVRSRWLSAAALLLLAGALLFATGVAVHALTGVSLGPVAPAGGAGLVAGWLLVAVGGASFKAKTTAERP